MASLDSLYGRVNSLCEELRRMSSTANSKGRNELARICDNAVSDVVSVQERIERAVLRAQERETIRKTRSR